MKCVSDRFAHSFAFTAVLLAACADQRPDAVDSTAAPLSISTNVAYTLANVASGKCVAIQGGSSANSARAQVQPCNAGNAQAFKISAASSAGYYSIRNAGSSKCLDVESRSTADGANIIQYACNGNTNQQWALNDLGSGLVRLTAKHSGKVAEVYGSTANGTYLTQRAAANRSSQQFTLTAITTGGGGSGTGGASAGTAGTGGIGGASAGTDVGGGDQLGTRSAILAAMEHANDYFMAKWPDPGANIVTDKTRPSHIWTRVRVLQAVPEGAPHRDEYLADYHSMSDAVRSVQRSDGFWNVSLHDPTHFGGKELSGTALFTYGIAYGARTGLLDPNVYAPIASRAWNGMVRDALRSDGFLGYVQSTGKQPSDGQPLSATKAPNFEDFGLGCFLLAGSEVFRLALE